MNIPFLYLSKVTGQLIWLVIQLIDIVMLSIGPLGANLSRIIIEISTIPFKKMHLKI